MMNGGFATSGECDIDTTIHMIEQQQSQLSF